MKPLPSGEKEKNNHNMHGCKPRYWTTPTAKTHYRKAVSDTRDRWGINQAEKYRDALAKGFQYIAENRSILHSSHREGLAESTEFSLHLVEHHYVVFQEYGDDVIIAAIFHEHMDIPTHLSILQSLSRHEIASIIEHIGASLID